MDLLITKFYNIILQKRKLSLIGTYRTEEDLTWNLTTQQLKEMIQSFFEKLPTEAQEILIRNDDNKFPTSQDTLDLGETNL